MHVNLFVFINVGWHFFKLNCANNLNIVLQVQSYTSSLSFLLFSLFYFLLVEKRNTWINLWRNLQLVRKIISKCLKSRSLELLEQLTYSTRYTVRNYLTNRTYAMNVTGKTNHSRTSFPRANNYNWYSYTLDVHLLEWNFI